MTHILRERYDFTTPPYRDPTKLSPRVSLLLIKGTSLLLWLTMVEAIGAVQ